MGKKRRSSGDDSTDKSTTKRRKQSDQYNTLFGKLTQDAGFILHYKDGPHEIKVDQAVFQRSLVSSLKKHADHPQVIDEYMVGVGSYIEDPVKFYWSLMPTVTATGCESARTGSVDSLLRILLGVDLLQPKLMTLLLEKIAELEGTELVIPGHPDKVNIPRLIMNQFRWLDRIVNSKELATKMLEIIGISPVDVQREIIACLPEVVEDNDHQEVAQELQELLRQNTQQTVAILDALSNLCLKSELLTEVRGSVIQTLASVDLEDLPVVIKFLLQTVAPNDCFEVVQDLRSKLDFHSSFPPSCSSTPGVTRKSRGGADAVSNRSTECLVLDAIHSAIRFQKCVAEAWIKVINGVKITGEHKVIDLIVLFILHSTGRKKPIESLIRNKIRAGHFSEVLIQAAFGAHAAVLRDYFQSILSLSEIFLRSPEPAVGYFGSAMYKNAFLAFDTYYQQEIIGNLVTHIGSGFEGEVDSSLDILLNLVETSVNKMAPFAIFVKGVLDYLDNLSVTQIRKLYSMLSVLAFKSQQDGGLIQDDMHIIIRKQLSNSSPRYKRMGVIGAIMVVKSLGSVKISTDPDRSSSSLEDSMSQGSYRQVIQLLQLVQQSSANTPEVMALFMDELANVVQKGLLDQKVEAWISENVISNFQDDFVVDITPVNNKDNLVPVEVGYGLDDENESTIAINLLPLVLASLKAKPQQKTRTISPACLAPQFRLLRTCEMQQNNGDLEGIDALLGCSVYVCEDGYTDKFDSLSRQEREATCMMLFYLLNWFREVVNGFANQPDVEMKGKVISRLQNITVIQTQLQKCLAATPSFVPPTANFDFENCKPALPAGGAQQTTKKGKKVAGKSAKNKLASDENTAPDDTYRFDSQQDTQVTEKDPKDVAVEKTVSLEAYRAFFR